MTRSKYPAECPVFEASELSFSRGSLRQRIRKLDVVGVDIGSYLDYGVIDTLDLNYRYGGLFAAAELRPLTRAAREMLALVSR